MRYYAIDQLSIFGILFLLGADGSPVFVEAGRAVV